MFGPSELAFCLLAISGVVSASNNSASQFDPCSYAAADVLVRDVIVIGGGASGTYGAIALKDAGRSVAVVEKQGNFGGHVNTYNDAATGLALEYGVQGYSNDSITRAFFERFNVPFIPLFAGVAQLVEDFNIGKNVTPVTGNSILTWSNFTNAYYPDPALGVHLPSPVPEDLLLPFRDFIKKYHIEDAAFLIWSISGPTDNLLDQLTLYVVLGANAASAPIPGGAPYIPEVATRNNSEVYGKAQVELGKSALLNSQVVASQRSNKSVKLVVQSGSSKKLLIASQVLYSAPIILDNLNTFDLDSREHDIFKEVYYTAWYTTLVTDTGLAPGYSYENAANNTLYNIPIEPYTFHIGPSRINTTFYAFYGATHATSEADVRAAITQNIRTLSGNTSSPKILAFASHTPFKQLVSADAIRAGFYDKLNALQGYRGMFYTGNALDVSGSSSLYNFTQHLVPGIQKAVAANKVPADAGKCKRGW
ncbi:hypothetical protein LTR78_005964 [Recurvomyces mirabilis]|uniref:FAD dependent oxidoreductase n=1 Tax=Recurvomyces mirabilis TaxID=574656 RepID=A0AAE0WLX9_9PEZI|nr:hypothetical protein LTR78_005964 [Recurvomyces mirabilis]KAK5155226.1 hypothetical protein LTS14_006181 [Recurvomyces mirabilis]